MTSNEEGTQTQGTDRQEGRAGWGNQGQDQRHTVEEGQLAAVKRGQAARDEQWCKDSQQGCVRHQEQPCIKKRAQAASEGYRKFGRARPLAAGGAKVAWAGTGHSCREILGRGRRRAGPPANESAAAKVPTGWPVRVPAISGKPRVGAGLANAPVHLHESTGPG
jgi:hypothetical protein